MLLARAYLLTGEQSLARESLDRAVALKPSMTEAHTLLVGLDAAAGQLKEAKQRLDLLIAQDPNNVGLLGMQFQLQLQGKDWGKSQDTLKQLRKAGANEALASLAEGHVALGQQQWMLRRVPIPRRRSNIRRHLNRCWRWCSWICAAVGRRMRRNGWRVY